MTDSALLKWSIDRAAENRFILRTRGGTAIVEHNLVFAALLHEPPPEEWIITAQPQHGKNVFTQVIFLS